MSKVKKTKESKITLNVMKEKFFGLFVDEGFDNTKKEPLLEQHEESDVVEVANQNPVEKNLFTTEESLPSVQDSITEKIDNEVQEEIKKIFEGLNIDGVDFFEVIAVSEKEGNDKVGTILTSFQQIAEIDEETLRTQSQMYATKITQNVEQKCSDLDAQIPALEAERLKDESELTERDSELNQEISATKKRLKELKAEKDLSNQKLNSIGADYAERIRLIGHMKSAYKSGLDMILKRFSGVIDQF